jgi:hypothetical protein
MFPQKGLQEIGMMVSGIVQNDHEVPVFGPVRQHFFKETLKSHGIEFLLKLG